MNGKMHLRYRHDGTNHYACNWAVGASNRKMTSDKSKVTCKNCRHIIKI
jgi:hypothetical protein